MDSMRMRGCRLVIVLTMMALVLGVILGVARAQGAIPKLVDVDWLKKNLTRVDVRTVDLRSHEAYLAGHVPGAIFLDLDMAGTMDAMELSTMLGKTGIDPGTIVVACSEESDWRATWLIWRLDLLGHATSAVLDGGFRSWARAQGSISRTEPEPPSKVYALAATGREEMRISPTDVKGLVERESVLLLDACTVNSGRGVSHSWRDDLTASGMWKSPEELRQAYKVLGATPERTILVACDQRDTASTHIYFTLKHVLGYPRVKIVSDGPQDGSSAGGSLDQSSSGTSQDPESLLKGRCTSCHGINKVLRHRADRAGWEKSVDKMIKRGAKLTPAERIILVDHLARNAK